MYIYQFIRRRGERYIRHSQRLFPTRIREHIPMWFYNREREATRSCIIEHLTEHIHSTDPYVDLKVVYTMSKLPRFLRIQLPKTLTLAIREDFQNCAYKSTSYLYHELKPSLLYFVFENIPLFNYFSYSHDFIHNCF